MLVDSQSLYKYLHELSVIDEKSLTVAFNNSQSQKIPFEKILLDRDLITDENLGKAISELIKIPLISLSKLTIPVDILRIVPEVVARKQKILCFKLDEKGLHLAMNNPSDLEVISFIEKKSGHHVIVYYATEKDLEEALFLYSKDIGSAFEEIVKESVDLAKSKNDYEAPIIKITATILSYAYQNKASDIHIEPEKEISLVRFRIDGILHDIIKLPIDLHSQIVTRIKVMANLRTDEHQSSQDGKLQFKTDEEELDVRVSIVPITGGEKIVMRILSEKSRQFSLSDLGISDKDLEKVTKAYQKPYGLLLATGPTGCGKTTTMYAVLKLINKREVNIMTIEDPVEYEIEGVNQIQVNPKANLTFADGLRSIVRQDPNIILVGEIRDSETAGIAINSAMTGHLVLSTLHTNDSATAIPRLIDMNVEPFLVASTINVIIAQRLVRKICEKCRYSLVTDRKDLAEIFPAELLDKHFPNSETITVYKGKGCSVCHNTGYTGRVGIYEVMEISENITKAIVERKDSNIIKNIAVSEGMTTMFEDGLSKIENGITTVEEVIRETKE